MPISQLGAINTTALVVPDLYVQIVPPAQLVLNGVPTNRIAAIGTATWGPVNTPTIIGTFTQYVQTFGYPVARKFDLGTFVNIAGQQGASDFRCVRVTDGTDAAASLVLVTSALTLTSIYTGTLGNQIQASISAGSKAASFRIVIGIPGRVPEVFDNITGTGNAFWVNAAAAINAGTGVLRGPSQIVIASAGAATTAAAAVAPTALSGGTDGVATITASVLIGQDTIPRKGMYAVRGLGCSIGALADADDTTQWTTQDSFGLSEGIYMMLVGPSGDTIANAVTTKATAGLDDYASKVCFGNWMYWNDQTNGILRAVSPQGFFAGLFANMSPQLSSLNKPVANVVASQKSGLPGSGQASTFSSADLTALFQAGIDVITNPVPGGNYWGVRGGFNASSNAAINDDTYTRMTNFIAATLNAGMGKYVGQAITPSLLKNIRGTLLGFLQNLLQQNLLALNLDGSLPFSVVCDITNNPQSRTSLDYVQADCQVQYLATNRYFIVNLQGGQTVVVSQAAGPVTQ